jgi:hypothetical protein
MLSRTLPVIALLCFAAALRAQHEAPARYQVYGGYSYLSNSLNGVPGAHKALNGWDAGVAFAPWRGFRFKVDVADYFGTNLGAPQRPYFIMGGEQYNWTVRRETLFAEGLGGVGSANKKWGENLTGGETASFAALLGGGLDTRVTRHVAVRVEGGYQYSYFALVPVNINNPPYRVPGLPTNFCRLSSGLVWEF